MPAPSALLLATIRLLLAVEAVAAALAPNGPAIFVSLAALVLTFVPALVAHRVALELPQSFLAALAVFVMASLYLGEIRGFYDRLWWWDLVLHAGSAMGFGVLGFLLILMLFEGDRYAAPPWALGALSFCLAMTVGTLWEIFEYAMDTFFGFNMMKTGLDDTMGDLVVDAAGALVASTAGVVYLVTRGRWRIVGAFDAFIAANRARFARHVLRHRDPGEGPGGDG